LPEDKARAEDLGAVLFQQKTLKTDELDRFLHWLQKLTELDGREADQRPAG